VARDGGGGGAQRADGKSTNQRKRQRYVSSMGHYFSLY